MMMFNKSFFKKYAIGSLILNTAICICIMLKAYNYLPSFIMGILYFCVGINDWRFQNPKNYVGAAIDGWLMTVVAILDFFMVSKLYPSLRIWGWIAIFLVFLNLPAMINPHYSVDSDK